MKKLYDGFKLFQPWASEVVKGNLNFLIRTAPTIKRGIVGVIATKKIDKEWIKSATINEIRNLENKIGLIGTVKIKDCKEVILNNIKKELLELENIGYWEKYPKNLIPKYTRTGNVFIWILEDTREFQQIKKIEGGGILWAKITIED